VVGGLVSDLARTQPWGTGEPECTGVKWGGDLPARPGRTVGAVSRAENKLGIRRWSTKGTIGAADPNKGSSGGRQPSAFLARLVLHHRGTLTAGLPGTETLAGQGGAIINAWGPLTTGREDRAAHNEAGASRDAGRAEEDRAEALAR